MTTRREQIDHILSAHDAALREMQQSRAEMRAAHRHIVEAMHAMEAWASAHDAAADQQDAAIEAVMHANRAALQLLRAEDQ